MTDEFLLVVLVILVFLTYRLPDWRARYLRLGLILIAFTLPLIRLWQTAESTWNIVLGLLPWADAMEYYFDASRLIEGDLFSAFSGRRPLYASLLAVLLKLSEQNLQITLILFTVINGLAVFFFAEEIFKQLGSVPAVVAMYLSQLFYRPYVGTTLTEQLGYPVGLLALVILMRAVKTRIFWLFSLGIMLLTYALLIRAGTFFVIPILILFGVVNFAKDRRDNIKFSIILLAALAIPILSNSWLGSVIASPGAVEFANFADTLYGQARGGVRWTQAVIDHPELASMTEPDRSRLLYRLAFEEIKNNPMGLVQGSVKAIVDFIRPGPLSGFGFLNFGNKVIDFLSQASAALLFLFGLWRIWMNRKNAVLAFMFAFWLGTFLSIPFLPPIDAGVRPYAATIGSLFLPVCFVFYPVVFKSWEDSRLADQMIPVGVSCYVAFALILLSLIGAPLLNATARPVHVQPVTCASGLVPVRFKINTGSYISLSSQEEIYKTQVPKVLLSDVRQSFDDFPYGSFASLVRKIREPVLIAAVTDISTGQGMWVVIFGEQKGHEGQVVSGCAEMIVAVYPVLFIRIPEKP
ncbi:MAG TPA: hypothetical protein VFY26_12575 [Anaerolineales bacterium]|nr:hypothetical protein [Anaerolineales bacterium]